jgi:hypothetical protein
MIRWLVLALLIPASAVAPELEIAFGGSHPANPEVLTLVRSYTPHLMGWTSAADRDEKRRPMVVPGYFYHGIDGSFIVLDGLTARHTKNDLRILDRKFFDVVLHQYENTAILTYKDWSRGTDKGRPFEGYGSAVLVMTRTPEGWRVAADIVGQDPPEPKQQEAEKR